MNARHQKLAGLDSRDQQILMDFYPRGLVAFDLETTGLAPLFDKVIEIAAVKLCSNGELKTFHTLVNPFCSIPEHTIEFHAITNDMVRNSPGMRQSARDFMQFCEDLPIVAHNAQFDAGFIIRSHHEYHWKLSDNEIYDSCRFARSLFKRVHKDDKPKGNGLAELAKFYDIDLEHHRALDDALACLQIYARALGQLQTRGHADRLKSMAYLFKLSDFSNEEKFIVGRKYLPLVEMVQKQELITLIYNGGSTPNEERLLKAISLMPMPQGPVLYAECQREKRNKHFLLKKIKSFKLANT